MDMDQIKEDQIQHTASWVSLSQGQIKVLEIFMLTYLHSVINYLLFI
jgi:hypothetical protein